MDHEEDIPQKKGNEQDVVHLKNKPDISINTECPICSSSTSFIDVVDFNKSCEEIRGKYLPLSGIPIYYRICSSCNFVFASDIHTWDDATFLERIYNEDYITVDPDHKMVRPKSNFEFLVKTFGVNPDQINHLDYGGGNGLLSNFLSDKGWTSKSYDPFPKSQTSIEVLGTFNLITAFEVFEHVPHPKKLISDLLTLMSDDCLVLFSTLIIDENIRKNKRIDWWYASPRNGHISLYSRKSLELLTGENNLIFGSFNNGFHFLLKTSVPNWASHLIKYEKIVLN